MTRKRILILHRVEDRDTYDNSEKLTDYLHQATGAADFTPATFEELLFSYTDEKLAVRIGTTGVDVASFDAIFMFGWFKTKLLEDLAHSVALYAQYKNVPCLNSEALYERSKSKLSQYVAAATVGVSLTPFAFSCTSNTLEQFQGHPELSGDLIVKAIMGNRGNDNYKVNGLNDALKILGDYEDTPFVLQSFVPNDGDLRLIVLGDEVKLVIGRRASGDTHLSNTSKGGQATNIPVQEVPSAIKEDALRMARVLRREVSGIDMIVHKETGQHYLLEANNMPQLATGAFVQEKAQVLSDYFDQIS